MSAPSAKPAQMLTYDECAELLRLSKRTIARLVSAGELTSYHFGKAARIREAELRAYIATRCG